MSGCKVKFDLLAQLPLGADAVAIADDQHRITLGIDRRSADVAVEGRRLVPELYQVSVSRPRLIRRNRWSAGMRRSRLNR